MARTATWCGGWNRPSVVQAPGAPRPLAPVERQPGWRGAHPVRSRRARPLAVTITADPGAMSDQGSVTAALQAELEALTAA